MATLPELLRTLVDNNGSDLHITTQTPPQIRVHGKLQVLDLPVARAGRHEDAGLQRPDRRAEEALRGDARARFLVRYPRRRALPLQRFQSARLGRRRLPRHPRADQVVQRPRFARGHRLALGAAARPRPHHRADGQRQVDDARGDDRQDQHRAPRAHHHHRGSRSSTSISTRDVSSTSARFTPIRSGSPPRSAPRCVKIRTSFSSAKCATSRRSSRRCASPKPGT